MSRSRTTLAWNAEALNTLLEAELLRYLAVAHFGRGRGDWERAETPPHWKPVVERALAVEASALATLWDARGTRADDALPTRLQATLQPMIDRLLRDVLAQLYPHSPVPGSSTAAPADRNSTGVAASKPEAPGAALPSEPPHTTPPTPPR